MPDQISADQWALAFTHDFEPGFWIEGPHVYQLAIDCPATGQPATESDLRVFGTRSEIPLLDEAVYLRLSGMSSTRLGPPNLQIVSPDQPMKALITFIGLTSEQVESASSCTGVIRFDDGRYAELTPEEPFRP